MIGALVAGSVLEKLPWNKILIGLVIVVILYIIYRQGVKSGALGKPKKTDVPKDVYSGGNLLVDGSKVNRIATELHDDMQGWNMVWDEDIYNEFAQLSDSEFVSVDNKFNETYLSEGEGTLKEWIVSQNFVWGSFTLPTLIEEVILPRMARLNLV